MTNNAVDLRSPSKSLPSRTDARENEKIVCQASPNAKSFPPRRLSSRWKLENKTTQTLRLHEHRLHLYGYREAEKHVHEGFSRRLQLRACACEHGQNWSFPHKTNPANMKSNMSFKFKRHTVPICLFLPTSSAKIEDTAPRRCW